jgi:hypothetical protein
MIGRSQSNRSPLERGTEIFDAETNRQTWPFAQQRPLAETHAGAKKPHSGAINARRLMKVSTQGLGGGRTRARTWDPMIKSTAAPRQFLSKLKTRNNFIEMLRVGQPRRPATRYKATIRFLFDKAGLAPRDCQSDYLEMLDLGRSIKKQTDKSDILLSPLSVENHLLLRLRNECDSFGFAFVSSHHAGQAS